MPPGGPPPAPGSNLDQPPPGQPLAVPGQPSPLLSPEAGGPTPQSMMKDMAKQLVGVGAEIDRALLSLAEGAPEGQQEFKQARALIQAGIAKHLAASGAGAASASPTAIGGQFPGGGFSSAK